MCLRSVLNTIQTAVDIFEEQLIFVDCCETNIRLAAAAKKASHFCFSLSLSNSVVYFRPSVQMRSVWELSLVSNQLNMFNLLFLVDPFLE